MMRSYSNASGGVVFVPEHLERKTKSVSYRDLVSETEPNEKPRAFGKKKSAKTTVENVA